MKADPQIQKRNERLYAAYTHGVSIDALAERFSLAPTGVKRVVYFQRKKLGVTKKWASLPADQIEKRNAEIIARHDNGEAGCEIFRTMGLTRGIVGGVIWREKQRRMGL